MAQLPPLWLMWLCRRCIHEHVGWNRQMFKSQTRHKVSEIWIWHVAMMPQEWPWKFIRLQHSRRLAASRKPRGEMWQHLESLKRGVDAKVIGCQDWGYFDIWSLLFRLFHPIVRGSWTKRRGEWWWSKHGGRLGHFLAAEGWLKMLLLEGQLLTVLVRRCFFSGTRRREEQTEDVDLSCWVKAQQHDANRRRERWKMPVWRCSALPTLRLIRDVTDLMSRWVTLCLWGYPDSVWQNAWRKPCIS